MSAPILHRLLSLDRTLAQVRAFMRSTVAIFALAFAATVVGDAAAEDVLAGDAEAQAAAIASGDALAWRFSAGFDYSRGDYGLSDDTTLYYVPLGVTADWRRWRVRLSVPLLWSDGPTSIIESGAPPSPVPGDGLRSERNGGLGEIAATASYLFEPLADGLPYVEIGLQTTAPTRTRRELGTGDWAFTTRLDLFLPLADFTPFAAVGRRFYLSDGLDDRFQTSLGASLRFGDSLSLGLAYDWLEASSPGADDAHELVPFATLALSQHWSIGPYGVIGLSQGSPDYGVGVSVSFLP